MPNQSERAQHLPFPTVIQRTIKPDHRGTQNDMHIQHRLYALYRSRKRLDTSLCGIRERVQHVRFGGNERAEDGGLARSWFK